MPNIVQYSINASVKQFCGSGMKPEINKSYLNIELKKNAGIRQVQTP